MPFCLLTDMASRITWSAKTWPSLARYSNALVGGLIVAAGVMLLVALWLGWIDILPYTSQVGDEPKAHEPTAAPNVVELTPEKLAAQLKGAFAASFTPLDRSGDVFSWDPV